VILSFSLAPVAAPELESNPVPKIPSLAARAIDLVEEKVFAEFNKEQKECLIWVLDTGATNHMTGCQSAFSNLHQNIHGTVKFEDGSVVQTKGVGTILFQCKNGEHHAFAGVYFIPRLTTNIISVGQLEKGGFQTIIDGGVMRIRDIAGHLLAMVNWSANRLYILNVELASPVCLVMKGAECVWLWHIKFGHLNFSTMRKLAREGMVHGLLEVDQAD
jgi:hypothetical protein